MAGHSGEVAAYLRRPCDSGGRTDQLSCRPESGNSLLPEPHFVRRRLFYDQCFMNDGVYNQDFLNAQPAVEETKFLRHVRFEKPMVVKMDGKKKLGVVLMPGID